MKERLNFNIGFRFSGKYIELKRKEAVALQIKSNQMNKFIEHQDTVSNTSLLWE